MRTRWLIGNGGIQAWIEWGPVLIDLEIPEWKVIVGCIGLIGRQGQDGIRDAKDCILCQGLGRTESQAAIRRLPINSWRTDNRSGVRLGNYKPLALIGC